MKTPEHFEKKDYLKAKNGLEKLGMIGYNRALEKTNAKELYEALFIIVEHLNVFDGAGITKEKPFGLINIGEKALEKANKP